LSIFIPFNRVVLRDGKFAGGKGALVSKSDLEEVGGALGVRDGLHSSEHFLHRLVHGEDLGEAARSQEEEVGVAEVNLTTHVQRVRFIRFFFSGRLHHTI